LLTTDDGPPHIIKETHGGIDIEITKSVLALMGYRADVMYAPLSRGLLLVEKGKADLTVPTFFQQDNDSLFFSKAIIEYKPTVFSLVESGFKFLSLEDISGVNVSTFQGATGYFGKSFVAMTHVTNYTEHHDMSTLPLFLVQRKSDLVILDYYIFHYFLRKQLPAFPKSAIREHALIPSVSAHVGFNSKHLRDEFNQKLLLFTKNGGDRKIIKKYVGK